jgi:hypothetical protein
MKAASLTEIKKELVELEPARVTELCMRLAKYKKENKELLTYLLFEAGNEEKYVKGVKEEMDQLFGEINKSNVYLAKKSLRKILRIANKFIRYSDVKQTEIELRIHFCNKLNASGIAVSKSQVLTNLYQQQLKNITVAIGKLHEDYRYDYQQALEELSIL